MVITPGDHLTRQPEPAGAHPCPARPPPRHPPRPPPRHPSRRPQRPEKPSPRPGPLGRRPPPGLRRLRPRPGAGHIPDPAPRVGRLRGPRLRHGGDPGGPCPAPLDGPGAAHGHRRRGTAPPGPADRARRGPVRGRGRRALGRPAPAHGQPVPAPPDHPGRLQPVPARHGPLRPPPRPSWATPLAPLTDARLWFCAAFVACIYATTRSRTGRTAGAARTALLVSFPAVALPLGPVRRISTGALLRPDPPDRPWPSAGSTCR